MSLKDIVERDDNPAGRIFDLVVQVLIVVALVTFSLETLPDLSDGSRRILRVIEIAIVVLFSIEYLLRLIVATSKPGFVFSFFGLIDLAAILPFYLALGFDVSALRAARFLRVFRAIKLLRYSRALDRIQRAFQIAREELILFFGGSLVVIYIAAVGIYQFEHKVQPEVFGSVFDGMWWAVVSLTTVGYGDAYPVTAGGRIFTFVVLMVGLGIVAVPTGLFASALATARQEEREAAESKQDADDAGSLDGLRLPEQG